MLHPICSTSWRMTDVPLSKKTKCSIYYPRITSMRSLLPFCFYLVKHAIQIMKWARTSDAEVITYKKKFTRININSFLCICYQVPLFPWLWFIWICLLLSQNSVFIIFSFNFNLYILSWHNLMTVYNLLAIFFSL